MEFEIRNINLNDKKDLHSLIDRANRQDKSSYTLTEEWLDYIIKNMSEAVFLGFYKEKLVGLGTCMINSAYKDQAAWNVLVCPKFRKKGLGYILYNEIYNYSKSKNVGIVETYVKERLSYSVNFAEKIGFYTTMYSWEMEKDLKEEKIDLHKNLDLEFRMAEEYDGLDYKKLIQDGFGDELNENSLIEILKDPSITVWFLEKKEEIIGSLTVQKREGLSLAYIYDIVILKKHRKKGLGSYLIKSCLRDFNTNDISKISLSVTEPNKHALKLYKSIGFKEVDVDLIMVKDL